MFKKDDYRKYAVLYVDDEAQSLKYFTKAFKEDFWVLTASSAGEAEDILANEPRVGILITDQRMPGQTGVDLLGKVRRFRYDIVRILTTAYADMDSAIEAVNSGAVFKYVVKPWNLLDLRGCLLRGMEFFLVQKERDMLLREKMSVLQRLVISDRVRSLAVLAAGLSHHIRNPMTALQAFLDLTPNKLREELPDATEYKDPEFWEDFWLTAQKEVQRILQIIQRVSEAIVEPDHHFEGEFSLDQLVREGLNLAEKGRQGPHGTVSMDIAADLPPLKANQRMMERFFSILIREMVKLTPRGGPIAIRAGRIVRVWGTPGVSVLIAGNGPEWTDKEIGALFTPFSLTQKDLQDLGLDLLTAFFIAHHHGGDIVIHRNPPDGPGFEVLLPFDPGATERPSLEENCMEKIMRYYDGWETLQGGF